MKKIIFSLFILFLVLFISSCAKQQETAVEIAYQNITELPEEPLQNATINKPIIPTNITITDLSAKANKTMEELVRIVDVTESGDACIVDIKGVRTVIDKGKSVTVKNVTVYVLDVVPVHSQLANEDMCKVLVNFKNTTQ